MPQKQDFSYALTKLRKATISFVMSVYLSVRLSVRPHGTTRLPLKYFHYNLTRITGNSDEHLLIFMIISCSVLLRIRSVFQTKVVGKSQNTHFMFNNILFPKTVPFMM